MEKDDIINKSDTNQITIIYDFNKSKEFKIDTEYKQKAKKTVGETISKEKIFGEIFVKNNKNICKIIINNEIRDISSYLEDYQNYVNEDKLQIKLIGINPLRSPDRAHIPRQVIILSGVWTMSGKFKGLINQFKN